jgi:outer membrane protein assembly factor BamA
MEGMDGSNIAIRTPIWAKVLALAGLVVAGAWLARPAWAQSREIIGEVLVEGNRRTATQRVLRVVDSQPGKEFSRAVLLEDVARLGSTRLFKNVGVRDEPQADGKVRISSSPLSSTRTWCERSSTGMPSTSARKTSKA